MAVDYDMALDGGAIENRGRGMELGLLKNNLRWGVSRSRILLPAGLSSFAISCRTLALLCLIVYYSPSFTAAQANATLASATSPSKTSTPVQSTGESVVQLDIPTISSASAPSSAPTPTRPLSMADPPRLRPGTLEGDAYALLKLKAALAPQNVMIDWNSGTDPCNPNPWTFIGCNGNGTRVTAVYMSEKGLSGRLAPEVGLLTELDFFDISKSTIGGDVPKELGNCVKLTKLYLGVNRFSGSVPPELGNLEMVQEFTINNNLLNGTIPPEIGNLTNVRKLDLSFNPMNTSLPGEIGKLMNVQLLYLGSAGIYGPIPDTMGSMRFLQTLSLDKNRLSGEIPLSLANLVKQSLSELNLDGNNLTGYVPEEFIGIRLTAKPGNDGLCNNRLPGLPACPPDTRMPLSVAPKRNETQSNVGATAGGVIGALTGVVVIGAIGWWFVQWKRKRSFGPLIESQDGGGKVTGGLKEARHYRMSELQKATNNWNNVIGRGGFGPVYLGVLKNKARVAIKKMNKDGDQGAGEFVSEVDLLRRLHHRCLVNLVGWCDESEKMLVYEYKENGSLNKLLYKKSQSASQQRALSWKRRTQIILDVATGLDYLHHGASPPVIHRDIKSDNVLLDGSFNASLADFGISKAGSDVQLQATTVVKGTLGYLDPQYQRTHVATLSSDVYSFGMLTLEVIAGRRPIDPNQTEEKINLRDWAAYKLGITDLRDFVDPRLEGEYDENEVFGLMRIASLCFRESSLRPTMHELLHQLEQLFVHERRSKEESGSLDQKAKPSGKASSAVDYEYHPPFEGKSIDGLVTRELSQVLITDPGAIAMAQTAPFPR